MDNNFIKSEIWYLTINGAYQRVKIYKDELSENDIKFFEEQLKIFVISLEEEHYKKEVSSEGHLENILQLAAFFKSSEVLDEAIPAFGIAQKFLNLYLKYVWCLGEINEPPHFPVDRTLQRSMGIPATEVLSWTAIDTVEKYLNIIKLGEKLKGEKSLADFELRLFNEKKLVA